MRHRNRVAEANPIKQGLKRFMISTFSSLMAPVAEANPIKQGLKLMEKKLILGQPMKSQRLIQ